MPASTREGGGGRPEALVVGGGIVGLACAWRLAAAGLEVRVLDAGEEAPAASRVAAGMIAPVGEASWGEEPLLRAALEAAERWPGFAAELEGASGVEVPYRRRGALHVALDPDEGSELRRRAALHLRLGLDSRLLTPSAARRLEPGLAPALSAAVEAPGEAEVEPRALLDALARAASSAGASLERASVTRIEPREGTPRVELADGRLLRCERLVLAAGAWSGTPLLPEGLRPPVRPVKGEILRLRAGGGEAPCRRIIVGERFYAVPREGGELVVGATVEELGFDLAVTAGGVHELLREAYRALPDVAEMELVEASAGLRPGTPDNAPIVGWVEAGVLVATGMFRNGILLAPLVADAVAALFAGQPPSEPLSAIGPGRFARIGETLR